MSTCQLKGEKTQVGGFLEEYVMEAGKAESALRCRFQSLFGFYRPRFGEIFRGVCKHAVIML